MKTLFAAFAICLACETSGALADGHALTPSLDAVDQSVENGIVSADKVTAAVNGWMVVHRTDADMKPGPVVGFAPLRMGENTDVVAILTEKVMSGEMLMLMVHSEEGGTQTGRFEYTLGAKKDGPIRINDELVMTVITTN